MNLHRMAEKFMQEQFAIMKKYGRESHVDSKRYEDSVRRTERTFIRLRMLSQAADYYGSSRSTQK